jgi:hypothetical protein
MRHRIFVGSSSEEVVLANAIQKNLVNSGHTVKVWNQGIFTIGKNAFESLLQALDKFDAAVFVFAPNDLVTIRGQNFDSVRDNVVFELGMFTGRLGRDRTFWVVPKGQSQLRIASDLLGVLPAEYVQPQDGDWTAALAVPCGDIHDALMESARDRGRHGSPLSSARAAFCIHHINDVLEHLTSTVHTNAVSVDEDLIQTLPSGDLRVSLSNKADITISFGRIEDFTPDDPSSVVALPANEFFDDACITDWASALGAFVKRHFSDRIDHFKTLVAKQRSQLAPTFVEREEGLYQESYGVGATIRLSPWPQSESSVLLCAVTRKRSGEGIKAEPTYIFAGVQSICRIMNDNKLTQLHVPLLGSGHGDMSSEAALLCLLLAVVTMPDILHTNIVIFRKTPDSPPEIAPAVARKLLAFATREARR